VAVERDLFLCEERPPARLRTSVMPAAHDKISGLALKDGDRQLRRTCAKFGEELRDIRPRTGLSQAALARAIGVTRSVVCRLEQGDATVTNRTRARAAAALAILARYVPGDYWATEWLLADLPAAGSHDCRAWIGARWCRNRRRTLPSSRSMGMWPTGAARATPAHASGSRPMPHDRALGGPDAPNRRGRAPARCPGLAIRGRPCRRRSRAGSREPPSPGCRRRPRRHA
jgi:transcriptional regulator with XRE-family HTH domain